MKTELRKLVGLFSSRLAGQPVCESCGNEFSCGVSLHGCWCSELKLSPETRANLRSRYRGCLCRACLEQVAESEVATSEVDKYL